MKCDICTGDANLLEIYVVLNALLSSSALADHAKAQKHPANIRANMQQSSRDAMHIR